MRSQILLLVSVTSILLATEHHRHHPSAVRKDQRHLTALGKLTFPSMTSFGNFGNFGSFGLSKAWSITDKSMGEANTMTKGKGTSGLSINTDGTKASAKGEQGSMAGGNFINSHNSWSKDLFANSVFPMPVPQVAADPAVKTGFQMGGLDSFKSSFGGSPFGIKSAWMKTGQTMADSQSMAMGDGAAEISAGKAGVSAVAEGTEGTANKGSFANSLDAWSDEGSANIAPVDDKVIQADPLVSAAAPPVNLLGSPQVFVGDSLTPPSASQPEVVQVQQQQVPQFVQAQDVPQIVQAQQGPQQVPQQVPEIQQPNPQVIQTQPPVTQ